METRISLQTAFQFELTPEERRSLYIRLALSQYRTLRNPDYDEAVLLKQLTLDFKKFLVEAQSLNEQFPNNHTIQRIRSFFDAHHKQLLRLAK